jgi:1-acyl-sn-glycerol-3-phosphate acyltransferase
MAKPNKRPNRLLYHLTFLLIYPIFKIKNRVRINRKAVRKIKGPMIVIANHPSRPDFVYSVAAMYPHRLNVVVARYYTYIPKVNALLKRFRIIPKNLFNPDNSTIKSIMGVVKQGGSVLLMPEGRLSSNGTKGIMPDGIHKLVKKLEVPLVLVKINGAFFTGGKWITSRRRGRIEVTASVLLSKEEVIALSAEEIHEKIEQALEYNDFLWLAEHPEISYKGKSLASSLENILYVCPNCQSEFTLKSERHKFTCEDCGYEVTLNSRYEFESTKQPVIFPNILAWFNYQKQVVTQEIEQGKTLETEVILKNPVKNGKKTELLEVGRGKCFLNCEGLKYTGTQNNQPVELFFPISIMPTLLFGCNEDFEIYHDNQFYYFMPIQNRLQTVKWSIYTEAAYQKYQENKNKAS